MARPRKYHTDEERRAAGARRVREHRARQRAAASSAARPKRPRLGTDAGALAKWAKAALRVPAGHPRGGKPFVLPPWQQAVIADVLSNRETLLCCPRKQGKTTLIAALLLGYLVGPLRRQGIRIGVLSVNRSKAGEMLRAVEAIATASGIEGLTYRRSPWPGEIRAPDSNSTVEIEGAGHASGHSSSFDVSIVDELGLLLERDRPAVNGMRSAVSAKDGKFVALTIHGPGPFVDEVLARRGQRGLAIHHYRGDVDAPLDCPKNHAAANPGLATGIKSRRYMRDEAARVLLTPSDQPSFLALDLNLPQAPAGELVVTLPAWKACETAPGDLPERRGPAFVGLDLGAHKSFTSAAMFWPESGRLEVATACPSSPPLAARARSDAAGSLYERAVADGDLLIMDGVLTPVAGFLGAVARRLTGVEVAAMGADRMRHAELRQALVDLRIGWPLRWRGGGIRSTEDAAADVRAFQTAVDGGELRTKPNVLMLHAIAESTVVRDSQGRAVGLKQARVRARVDCLQAAVIALGLAAGYKRRARPLRSWRSW